MRALAGLIATLAVVSGASAGVAAADRDIPPDEDRFLNAPLPNIAITTADGVRTDVVNVVANLSAAGGGDDGQPDNVVVNGTNRDDVVVITETATDAQVADLSALVAVSGAIAGSDRLTVNGLAGADVVDASELSSDSTLLTLDGGDGDDVLIGGQGDDAHFGSAGDDVLIGGPGDDTIDGGPGDNVVVDALAANTVSSRHPPARSGWRVTPAPSRARPCST